MAGGHAICFTPIASAPMLEQKKQQFHPALQTQRGKSYRQSAASASTREQAVH
jgi:hypothetical protein